MADVLDIVGYAVWNPSQLAAVLQTASIADQQVYIPLLPGSRANFTPNVVAEFTAAGLWEPANWLSGLTQPAALIRTRLYLGTNGWGTSKYLNRILGLGSGDRASGQINSVGAFQWIFGGTGGDTYEFATSYVDRMQITWGGAGDPVEVSMLVLPAGNPAAALTVLTNTIAPPYGRAAMSHLTTYGTFAGVLGGSLTFMNNLQPDLTTGNAVATDGNFYPPTYFNGPLITQLDVTQKANSATLSTPNQTATTASGNIVFADGAGTRTFSLNALMPNKQESIKMSVASIDRSFRVVRTSAANGVTIT